MKNLSELGVPVGNLVAALILSINQGFIKKLSRYSTATVTLAVTIKGR